MDGPLETEGINGINGFDHRQKKAARRKENLYDVFHLMLAMIFFPDSDSSAPVLQRIKKSLSENGPLLKDAIKNTGRKVLLWTRRGSHLRLLLVISVGTITLLTLTGLLVFMLFFLAATANAIIVSLFISLAAVGGFLSLFFAFVTAIYIGALSVAVFVISTATISAIIAVLISAGGIGFFWTVWLVTKKSVGVATRSLSMTGSVISAYSPVRHAQPQQDLDKASD
ncbi:hypothetical protein P3X46_029412 [Hevea brasiliensis]|uniref:PGG domain-containing protein n=1 Tax=Hevea brasiliensis TaxID=3981 RepID=A0ABQ9KTV0_HEVBR|nr:uncharacterized protein LOC110637166 [Hevea brasiliensis]KAJ9147231.1 hypothetical protein P3X46_029412 [Hevea brasiliensis]